MQSDIDRAGLYGGVVVMNVIQRYELNTVGRDFFVGDIHGMFDLLEMEMAHHNFDESKDRIFSVGDLVDRGERSNEAVDWVSRQYFHAVRGNHEDMAIRAHTGNMDKLNHVLNGGAWIVGLSTNEQKSISVELSKLPYMIEVQTIFGRVGIVHAELIEGDWHKTQVELMKESRSSIKSAESVVLWGRMKITEKDDSVVTGIDHLVVGHTPVVKPIRLGNVCYIDTGACFGRSLQFVEAAELFAE